MNPDRLNILNRALQLLPQASTVLDIGPGDGACMKDFRAAGHKPLGVGLDLESYGGKGSLNIIEADYMEVAIPPDSLDAVWASHVLEHAPNKQAFIEKMFADLKPDGWLFVTVPPMKPQIVGGHVNLFNAGLLLYSLILGGFDCSRAKVKTIGYNIAVFVQKRAAVLPELRCDSGDIQKLAEFFPFPVKQGFNGDLAEVNW